MSSETVPSTRPRWWGAALLNLFGGFGVGYLYARQPRRALVAAAAYVLMIIALWHGLGGWLAEPWVLSAVMALCAMLVIFCALDGALAARRTSANPSWYNRWWIYLVIIIAGGVAYSSALGFKRSVRTFNVLGGSMEPTLSVGDYVVADMRAFDRRPPERGDVVILLHPRLPSTTYLMRVIGLPGEEGQMKVGNVHVNGAAVPTEVISEYIPSFAEYSRGASARTLKRENLGQGRSVIVLDTFPGTPYDNTDVFKVPADHYFVMGDNRDNSTDSREMSPRYGIGYVPRANIIGKAVWIYWAKDWARIGARVE